MLEQKRNIIEYNINQPIFRLISLQNNNLLVVLKTLIKCLKSPDYSIENALDISINNQGIDAVCLWKNNIIIVKTNQKFYFIHINEGNYNFNIISEFNLLENIMLKSQKMISLNNKSNLLINTIGKFIILNEHQPNLLQIEKVFFGINANSFIQIRKNEIVCNSSEKKKVYFINSKKGNIISTINNINIYILDIDSFCLVNKNVLAMGGDLRDGIYLFDINKRELIYHYKEDYRGYNCLLSLGNNKFLGESYCGRCYGESDDEEEDLYCTHFFEFNGEENKIKLYKYSIDRIYELRRVNFIKFNEANKIAYSSKNNLYIENI
jgi:hypothetical protein